MDIQTIFYTLGSIFLVLCIIVMLGIVLLLWKAFQALQKAEKSVIELKDDFIGKVISFISSRPTLIAGSVGAGISSLVIRKIRGMFKK